MAEVGEDIVLEACVIQLRVVFETVKHFTLQIAMLCFWRVALPALSSFCVNLLAWKGEQMLDCGI